MLDPVALVDRAPEFLRRLAYRVAAGRGILGRAVDAVRFPISDIEIPVLPMAGDADVRLFIGPANSAGQAYEWARAFERNLPGVVATAMRGIGSSPFEQSVDLRVPVAVHQRSTTWHESLQSYLEDQTHVIWESGLPLLGRRYDGGVAQELALLGSTGVRGALLFHGSDIRPPSRHALGSRWSPFHNPTGRTRDLDRDSTRNAALANEAEVPVFVSTPDLLQWVPQATWCPVVVDLERWRAAAAPPRRSGPLVVAHAPSQKWLKGTDLIEPTLRRLDAEGVIEYRQIVGVPHASMPGFYAGADIVLDQFVLGIYGVAACESMASGRLVFSHVDEFTRAEVQARTGMTLPVHEVTVETLEHELRRAAREPDFGAELRAAGPDFVAAVHDGRMSASAVAPFLGISA